MLLLNCGVGEDFWQSLGLVHPKGNPSWIHCKDWCWSWSSNTLATWWEELTHWKRPWCWKRLKVGGEGDDRGWDGWLASLTQWTWVWASSGSWWWTGKPGMLQPIRLQRLGHDWASDLNWMLVENHLKYNILHASLFPIDPTGFQSYLDQFLHHHLQYSSFIHL